MPKEVTKLYLTAQKYWRTIVDKETTLKSDTLTQQIETHKKLLSIFHPGNYYYLLFDLYNGEIANISSEVLTVLGYQPNEITAEFLINGMHPDDKPLFLHFEDKVTSFWKTIPAEKYKHYKVQYDIRLKNKDNKYVRILMQYVLLNYDEYNIYHSFHCHTDITNIKSEGEPCFSIIGLDGEPSYYNIRNTEVFTKSYDLFTKRERQILKCIIEGKSSKEIADELYISGHTVNAHRKNILLKANCKSPVDLVSKAINEGWI